MNIVSTQRRGSLIATFLLSLLGCLAIAGCHATENPDRALAITVDNVAAEFPDVPVITTSALAAKLAEPEGEALLLLDIREPKEYAVSHLPGAINVPPDTPLEDLPGSYLSQPVVVYCSVGYRSSSFGRRLMSAGASDVSNLEGSIFKWANEERALTGQQGPTSKVHPFNEKWGRQLRQEFHSYR